MADVREEGERPSPSTTGADQSGVRAYNERLVLSLVRRSGSLSKIEVSRATGLSVQSTSAIMNRLQSEGLLQREAPLRGRVGQPTVPLSLDPEGAFSLGLRIGRRSSELVLADFCGRVRDRRRREYSYPTPETVFNLFAEAAPELTQTLSPAQQLRISGVGVAAPFDLWDWPLEVGAPKDALDVWRGLSVEDEVRKRTHLPVAYFNDATAACAAELFFGEGWRYRNFVYVFVGYFVGGGLVIDGALHPGSKGNAAALGSMLVASRSGRPQQLIACASISLLVMELEKRGIDPSSVWRSPDHWDDFGKHLDAWLTRTSQGLAFASVAARSLLEIEAVVIDGAMPKAILQDLIARTRSETERLDQRGLSEAVIVAGAIGADARARGAAALPLIKSFARDREVLLKHSAAAVA